METAWSNILDYKNVSDRYVLTEEDKKGAFARQYFEVYEARVNALKPRIIEIAERDIGKGKFKHISLSDAKQDEEIFVIGVIVKRIAARPSILKSLLNEDKVAYDDYEGDEEDDVKRYAGSSEDRIELESEMQIVCLDSAITMAECATGCCVGVLGKLGKEGVFHVNRLIWPSSKISKKSSAEGTIVFVSGLELTGDMEEDQLTISGLEFMSEWMNSEALGENQCPPIDRVVVIGPIVETKSNGCDVQSVVRTLTLSRTEKQSSAKALITVDRLISPIAEKPLVNTVDVTPGVGDPCSSMWPLPPIHRVCLQRCAMSQKKVNLVTNPYEFEVNGLRVMTMPGENVTELLRTSHKWTGADVHGRVMEHFRVHNITHAHQRMSRLIASLNAPSFFNQSVAQLTEINQLLVAEYAGGDFDMFAHWSQTDVAKAWEVRTIRLLIQPLAGYHESSAFLLWLEEAYHNHAGI